MARRPGDDSTPDRSVPPSFSPSDSGRRPAADGATPVGPSGADRPRAAGRPQRPASPVRAGARRPATPESGVRRPASADVQAAPRDGRSVPAGPVDPVRTPTGQRPGAVERPPGHPLRSRPDGRTVPRRTVPPVRARQPVPVVRRCRSAAIPPARPGVDPVVPAPQVRQGWSQVPPLLTRRAGSPGRHPAPSTPPPRWPMAAPGSCPRPRAAAPRPGPAGRLRRAQAPHASAPDTPVPDAPAARLTRTASPPCPAAGSGIWVAGSPWWSSCCWCW